MTCIAPNEIQEGDLIAYLDGAATRKVKAHIKKCNYCAALVADLRETQNFALNSMYRSSCPSTDTLSDYQSGSLTVNESRGIRLHVQKCPHCTRELKELETLNSQSPHQLDEEIRRAVRTVIDAIRLQPPSLLAGLQSVRGGEPAPVLYQASGFDIFLGSQPDGSKWQLRGRATRGGQEALELVGLEVWLMHTGSLLSQATVDERGWFSFDQLSPGEYDLWLVGDNRDIVIKQVIVGAPGAEK